MDTLHTLKQTLTLAFLALPLLLISTLGFLAVGTANIGYFWLLIGQVAVVPILVPLIHMITQVFGGSVYLPSSSIGQLVPSAAYTDSAYMNIAPSYWMAQVGFFFGYLLWNAMELYRKDSSNDANALVTQSRQSKALAIMIFASIVLLTAGYLRYRLTHAERLGWAVVSALAFGALGGTWSWLGTFCGITRTDVFNIASMTITSAAAKNAPKVCMYAPNP
jgi:hypothetical protein